MENRNGKTDWNMLIACLPLLLLIVGLPLCVFMEGYIIHPKLYEPVTTGGTIISDGIVVTPRMESSVCKDYDPSVIVQTDDDVRVRVELYEGFKSPYYKLVKGERVWLTREKKMAFIPFLPCNEYGGQLIFPKEKI